MGTVLNAAGGSSVPPRREATAGRVQVASRTRLARSSDDARPEPSGRTTRETPPAPDPVAEMASALEDLAHEAPRRAMALALGEGDSVLRQEFRDAVLRGWASVDPDEAAAWAMALPDGEHHLALEPVFAGAARQPARAVALGGRLAARDPTLAGDFGQLLITALADAGELGAAARFAAEADSENLPALTNLAFAKWAAQQPEQALQAFDAIAAPEERQAAWQGLMSGWSEVNPAALADYLVRLPSGAARTEALAQVLPRWVGADPLAASHWWVEHFPAAPGLEGGVAAVIALPQLLGQRPELARVWAESIDDPDLRAAALQRIQREGTPPADVAPRVPSG